jgi:bifunctional non-homologous end joining protein LigD
MTRARAPRTTATRGRTARAAPPVPSDRSIVTQLEEIQRAKGDGTVEIARGVKLSVSSLGKIFFPAEGITKGDLMRYYSRVAGSIVPLMRDRPLVLKRYPNGIEGESFYQQKAPEHVPSIVRVETIKNERAETQRRFIGGDLATLLYTIQLGAISVDTWHSRVPKLELADFTILDLDPGPKAPFSRVIEVAILVREELTALGINALAKTSGASGLHIVLPLKPAVSDETAVLAAQIVATRVVARAPSIATIERSVAARPAGTVYVDYLQSIRGKTVAAAYSVRARPGATVSAPIDWGELDTSLDPREFTIETIPDRVTRVGDIWAREMKKGNSIRAFLEAKPGKAKSR